MNKKALTCKAKGWPDSQQKVNTQDYYDDGSRKSSRYYRHIAINRFAKTIIFCENIDHAERMRQAMVNANPDLVAANAKYVMRITDDNNEGKAQLMEALS